MFAYLLYTLINVNLIYGLKFLVLVMFYIHCNYMTGCGISKR